MTILLRNWGRSSWAIDVTVATEPQADHLGLHGIQQQLGVVNGTWCLLNNCRLQTNHRVKQISPIVVWYNVTIPSHTRTYIYTHKQPSVQYQRVKTIPVQTHKGSLQEK